MPRRRTVIVTVLCALLAGACVFAWLAGLGRSVPAVRDEPMPEAAQAVFPEARNFRQGRNQCGPYAAAAFAYAVGKTDARPENYVARLPWKLPRGYTHPHALEALLRSEGVPVRAYALSGLTEDGRVRFLRREIADGKPVILLVHLYGYQHYVTVLGYDAAAGTFAIYDPLHERGSGALTADANGELPGNRTFTERALLDAWAGGGIAGFYRGYALSVL